LPDLLVLQRSSGIPDGRPDVPVAEHPEDPPLTVDDGQVADAVLGHSRRGLEQLVVTVHHHGASVHRLRDPQGARAGWNLNIGLLRQDVRTREDPHERSVTNHRQATDAPLDHPRGGQLEIVLRDCQLGGVFHHLADRRLDVGLRRGSPGQQITLRQHPDHLPVFDDGKVPDTGPGHHPDRLSQRVLSLDAEDMPRHEIAHSRHGHHRPEG
jgi:hypothetical protein